MFQFIKETAAEMAAIVRRNLLLLAVTTPAFTLLGWAMNGWVFTTWTVITGLAFAVAFIGGMAAGQAIREAFAVQKQEM